TSPLRSSLFRYTTLFRSGGGHDDAARVQRPERRDVRSQPADGSFVAQEHEQVEAARTDPERLGAECGGEAGGGIHGRGRRRGELGSIPLRRAGAGGKSAPGVEAGGLVRRGVPVLPHHWGAAEGAVAPEVPPAGGVYPGRALV